MIHAHLAAAEGLGWLSAVVVAAGAVAAAVPVCTS